MKSYVIIISLLFITVAHAQDLMKDTIQLENVSIDKKKVKIKSKYISSFCTHHENLRNNIAVVTLVDNLPTGYLHSITYVFNNAFDKKTAEFKDTEVELLFFEVKEDNRPGNRITYPKKRFL